MDVKHQEVTLRKYKILKKTLVVIPISVVVYLSVAGIWALISIDDLLELDSNHTNQITLSKEQVSNLLKIEDPTFFEHYGISTATGQGLTTITSSIARDIFLFRKKLSGVKGGLQSFYANIFKCCKKVDFGRDAMALVLNAHFSKDKQLSYFISNSYMGEHNGSGVIGFSNASLAYYDKPLSELSQKEFLGLVAMLKAPNRDHPIKNPKAHQQRTFKIEKIISGKCQPQGWLDTNYEHCAETVVIQ